MLAHLIGTKIVKNYLKENQFDQDFIIELERIFFDETFSVENPKFIVIAGSPGAGKTTYYMKNWKSWSNHYFHSFDEILVRLPLFKEDLERFNQKVAFENNWQTAQNLAEIMLNYAIINQFNIVYDRAAGTAQSFLSIHEAKHQYHYYIELHGVHVEDHVAKKRVIDRERTTGYRIPIPIIDEYQSRFRTLWPHYLKFIDYAELHSGSDSMDFSIIFSSENGVIKQLCYDNFLSIDLYPEVINEILRLRPVICV